MLFRSGFDIVLRCLNVPILFLDGTFACSISNPCLAIDLSEAFCGTASKNFLLTWAQQPTRVVAGKPATCRNARSRRKRLRSQALLDRCDADYDDKA